MVTVETKVKVSFEAVISDTFGEDIAGEVRALLIEEHIKDYCREHKIDRQTVQIIKGKVD